jgi:hypothetical protein
MAAAEGIQLREIFPSSFHQKSNKQSARMTSVEKKRHRENRDKVRAKQLKLDHFMLQAGALFVLK